MTDFTTELETTLVDAYNDKLEEMRQFLCHQIDRYLISKSKEWNEALAAIDVARMAQIRDEAHQIVDAAFDYKILEL